MCTTSPTPGSNSCPANAFSNPLVGYSASVPWIRAESNIDMVNSWTKVKGNHTFKWGVDLRRVRDDLLQDQTFSPRGVYMFADAQTSDASNTGGTNIANDIASLLLSQPAQVGRYLNTFFPCYRQWWFFAFGADKWQATSKLTVDWACAGSSIPRPRRGSRAASQTTTRSTIRWCSLALAAIPPTSACRPSTTTSPRVPAFPIASLTALPPRRLRRQLHPFYG